MFVDNIKLIKYYLLDNDFTLVNWAIRQGSIFQTAPMLGTQFCDSMYAVSTKCHQLHLNNINPNIFKHQVLCAKKDCIEYLKFARIELIRTTPCLPNVITGIIWEYLKLW